ncbi:MAG: c-type cytochrome [Crocinitomix sp.]|nr:c-type cytochrome [Crocinitomix sp.]
MNFFKLQNIFFIGAVILLASCKKDPPYVGEYAEYDNAPYSLKLTNNTLPVPNLPADNLLTIEKVKLGRMLFYEKALSKDGSMACASCHLQEDGFSDSDQFSEGVDGLFGARQAMAVVNLAWNENGFFWDGRAELLRHQSVLPIQDPLEMNETLENVIAKLETKELYSLQKIYKDQFVRAFENGAINELNISLALEAFMMSIVSDDSKYDRYLVGTATLTDSEERGRELFFGEYNEFFPETSGADCAHCHTGTNFENDKYINNGLDSEVDFTDLGRYDVTEDDADKAKFKVTSLRNIAQTGPYMHDGRFNTLEEVVNHYNGELHSSSTLDPALASTMGTGLMLDADEIADLIAFLHTLTDETYLNNADYKTPFQ